MFLQEPVYNFDHTVAEVGEALQFFVFQLGYDPLQLLVSSMSDFQREREGRREGREGGDREDTPYPRTVDLDPQSF